MRRNVVIQANSAVNAWFDVAKDIIILILVRATTPSRATVAELKSSVPARAEARFLL
jgi:hypothetical protein